MLKKRTLIVAIVAIALVIGGICFYQYCFGVNVRSDLKYSQEYVAGSGNIKGHVNIQSFSDKGKEYEIGANQYGMAVFKDPAAALAKLKKDDKAGIALIQKEHKLLPLSQLNYEDYKTYGWQVSTGTHEEREQASFVTQFMDIYESSFSSDN